MKMDDKYLLVHTKYITDNILGGKLIPVKIKTWENRTGTPEPIFSIIGNSKCELTLDNYTLFMDEQKAIKAITTIKKT